MKLYLNITNAPLYQEHPYKCFLLFDSSTSQDYVLLSLYFDLFPFDKKEAAD